MEKNKLLSAMILPILAFSLVSCKEDAHTDTVLMQSQSDNLSSASEPVDNNAAADPEKDHMVEIITIEEATAQLPETMRYAGKPIEPLCFRNSMEEVNTAPRKLDECVGDDIYFIDGVNLEYKNGFFTRDFREGNDDNPDGVHLIFQYKHIGNIGSDVAILSYDYPGGSGSFSNLDVYTRENDTITFVRNIASGDRCMGGVTDGFVKEGKVHYTQNLTPQDIYQLKASPAMQKNADKLELCAACCHSQAYYVEGQLQLVTLDKNIKNYADRIENDVTNNPDIKYNNCLNTVTIQYVKNGNVALDEAQLIQFSEDVFKQCLDKET